MQPALNPTLAPSASTIHKHQETRTMTRHILTLALAISAILAASTQAASLTWDINSVTTGAQAGGGTWTDGAGNWWDGSANATWNNATPDAASFGQSGLGNNDDYTVTLGSDIVAASISRSGGINGLAIIAPDAGGLYSLTLNGGFTMTRGMQIDAPLVLAGNGVSHAIGGSSYWLIINGDITETGGGANALSISFGPLLRLTGDNSFSGGLTAGLNTSVATIELGTNTAAGTGPIRLGQNNIWRAINGDRTLANPLQGAGQQIRADWYVQFEGGEFHFTNSSSLRLEGQSTATDARYVFRVDNAKTTFAGGIDNGGTASRVCGIVKEGPGTLVIHGDSAFDGDASYTEAITVREGTLILNGNVFSRDGSSGQKSTLVEAGATLGGTGTLNIRDGFALTAVSGGTLAPGESVGTFTVDGDVNLAGTLAIEIDGSGADLLVVNGELNLDGAVLSVSFIDGFAPTDAASWMVLDWGSLSGSGFSQINLPALSGPLSWDTSQLLTDGLLLLNIPEPSSLALLVLAGLAIRRRR